MPKESVAPWGTVPTLVPVGRLARWPDAGREVHVGIRLQRGPRRWVLGHNHAGRYGRARGLLYATEEEARLLQFVLGLQLA